MFAEVAAVSAVPFVVLLDEDVSGEAQQRGGVGEGVDGLVSAGIATTIGGLPSLWE